MKWTPLGFDLRSSFRPDSSWTVGDFGYDHFVQPLGEHASTVSEIITADLNLARHPWDLQLEDVAFRCWPSPETIPHVPDNHGSHRLLFWEVAADDIDRMHQADWFKVTEGRQVDRPTGCTLLGCDVINADMISELWEVDAKQANYFWNLDQRLKHSVTECGLIADEEALEAVRNALPVDDFCRWAAILRAWAI